jgi:hypothetical protein
MRLTASTAIPATTYRTGQARVAVVEVQHERTGEQQKRRQVVARRVDGEREDLHHAQGVSRQHAHDEHRHADDDAGADGA